MLDSFLISDHHALLFFFHAFGQFFQVIIQTIFYQLRMKINYRQRYQASRNQRIVKENREKI